MTNKPSVMSQNFRMNKHKIQDSTLDDMSFTFHFVIKLFVFELKF